MSLLSSMLIMIVSEWWYLGTLILAAGFGFAGVAGWPTFTTPGVVPYGVALSIIFVIPIGIIKAMTGIEVTLNVLAEFIGGMWVQGNAVSGAEPEPSTDEEFSPVLLCSKLTNFKAGYELL